MKIRVAAAYDVADLARMAESFHAQSCYAGSVDVKMESFISTVANLATNPMGVVLVAEDAVGVCGMAAGMASRHWFNSDHITGQELFWWVDERARGSLAAFGLFRRLEKWARDIGCKTFCMARTANLTPERLDSFYKRSGYVPQDIYYRRAL